MPTLVLTNFNIITATLGGFITLFGLVSYLLKERFYLSEALISLVFGVAFSPHGANWIRPREYALGSEENLDYITLYFTRLVLGVQLVLAGVQLPSRYLRTEWRPMAMLLGPGMTCMWLSSSLLTWAMVPNLPFLHALAIGSCVTPTDPVLSNSIVKGKFADKNIPKPLQRVIIAESGANDGLGYPFLFLALYLIKFTQHGGEGSHGGAGKAIEEWFVETWFYTIFLSVAYGILVGWIAKELLHYCERRKFVDRESFLVFAITLALFISGTCGMIGSDDVLACFVAGNAFTWDDWFRLETEDDSLQPTIDMLLNMSVFAWFGAVAPWPSFRSNDGVIPIYRLIFLGILILLFRRLPMVLAFHKRIAHIHEFQQAMFVGFFGPIGVGAIFYLYVSIDFLHHLTVGPNNEIREDARRLEEEMRVVIWFLAICSITVHGLSIPLGKLGYHFPRTMTQAWSTSQERVEEPELGMHQSGSRMGRSFMLRRRRQPDRQPSTGAFRIGGDVVSHPQEETASPGEPARPIRFPESGQNTPTPGSRTPVEQAQNQSGAAEERKEGQQEGDGDLGLASRVLEEGKMNGSANGGVEKSE